MIFDTRDEDSRFAMSAKEECVDEEVRWSGKEKDEPLWDAFKDIPEDF